MPERHTWPNNRNFICPSALRSMSGHSFVDGGRPNADAAEPFSDRSPYGNNGGRCGLTASVMLWRKSGRSPGNNLGTHINVPDAVGSGLTRASDAGLSV